MSESLSVFKFLFKKEWSVLKEILGNQEVDEFSNASELVTCLSEDNPNLIFTAINDKNDLIQMTNFIKMIKNSHQKIVMKVIVANFSGQRQFENAIQKLGIQDIIDPQINEKAFKHKYDFWAKGLEIQSKSKTTKNEIGPEKETTKKNQKDESQLIWQDALGVENDIWLIKNETSDCKRILGKWLIKLKGPGPYAGQWVSIPNKENQWKFEMREENREIFMPEGGDWIFVGDQRPDFIWKENLWLITGKYFKLEHIFQSKIDFKLGLRENNCVIAKNSSFAKTKEMFIDESFDKELIVKKVKESSQEKKIENENVISTHLEGEGHTDQIESKDLSGKITESQEELHDLEGTIQKNDEIKEVQKKDLADIREDELGGHYEGKVSNIKNDKKKGSKNKGSQVDEDVNPGNKDDTENKRKTKNKKGIERAEFDEDMSRFNELSGKGDTDEVEKYYSNLKKKDQEDPSEEDDTEPNVSGITKKNLRKIRKGEFEEDLSRFDELEGASETDELDKYYGTKNKKKEEDQNVDENHEGLTGILKNKKRKNEKQKDFQQDDIHDELDELNKTEKIKKLYKNKSTEKSLDTESEDTDTKDSNENEQIEDTQEGPRSASLLKKKKPGRENASPTDRLDRFYRKKIKENDKTLSDDEVLNEVPYNEALEDGASDESIDLSDSSGAIQNLDVDQGSSFKKKKKENEREDHNNLDQQVDDGIKGPIENTEDFDEQSDTRGLTTSIKKRPNVQDRNSNNQSNEVYGDDSSLENEDIDPKDEANESAEDGLVKAKKTSKETRATLEILGHPVPDDLKKAMQGAYLETFLTIDGKAYKCLFDDFFEDHFFVQTAQKHWETGQAVVIRLEFDYLDRKSEFNFSGKISEIDQYLPGQFFLRISLANYSKEELQKLLKLFVIRQEYAKVFIKFAQGF